MRRHVFAFVLSGVVSSAAIADCKPTAVIFDIDDTLVYTKTRTLRILQDIGSEEGIDELTTLDHPKLYYDCRDTLGHAGISAPTIRKVCDWKFGLWGKRFFTGEYLKYDTPVPGGLQYLKKVRSVLAPKVIFLTGRDKKNMARATKKQLEYYGFFEKGDLLYTKDALGGADHAYKKAVLDKVRERYNVVAVFDDSPSNATMFRESLPTEVPVVVPTDDIKTGERLGKFGTDFDMSSIDLITNYYFDRETNDGKTTIKPNAKRLAAILEKAKTLDCDGK